jgi:hypothetical protein
MSASLRQFEHLVVESEMSIVVCAVNVTSAFKHEYPAVVREVQSMPRSYTQNKKSYRKCDSNEFEYDRLLCTEIDI